MDPISSERRTGGGVGEGWGYMGGSEAELGTSCFFSASVRLEETAFKMSLILRTSKSTFITSVRGNTSYTYRKIACGPALTRTGARGERLDCASARVGEDGVSTCVGGGTECDKERMWLGLSAHA